MAKNTKPVTNWLDGAVETPRPDVAANKDRTKRQRFYRRFIVFAIIALPFSLVGNFLSYGAISNNTVAPSPEQTYSPEGKNAAILAVQSWLEQPFAPLPGGGRLVSWDAGERVPKPQLTEQQQNSTPLPSYDFELHTLTVVDGLGSTYEAQVQVAVSDQLGAVVLSTPSLLPKATPDTSKVSGASPWFGASPVTSPDAVNTAIQAWAAAYTSGDPDKLRLTVQDDNGSHTYVPLYNVADADVSVVTAGRLPDENGSVSGKPKTLLVQVKLAIRWVGQAEPGPGDKLATITYDLLVTKASTAAPQVVAWGGAGTAPSLEPYANALSGRAVAAPGTVPDQPKPTDNPSPAATDSPDSALDGN